LAAVGVAAEHAAGVGVLQRPARRLHAQAAVADAEVELAVGAEAQAVQVVADVADVYAEAVVQPGADVRPAVPLRVAQLPQVGDAGEPDVAPPRHQAGADARLDAVEAVGEHRGVVGPAVAVGILQEADAVVLDRVVPGAGAAAALHHGQAVRDGAAGQVVVE